MTIYVSTPSRLHFGLLDLSGLTRSVDGGIGLAIESPCLSVSAAFADDPSIVGPEWCIEQSHFVIEALRSYIPQRHVSARIETDVLLHQGFGSVTQLRLALGTALLHLAGTTHIGCRKLAVLLMRGATSGVGIYTFGYGGLVVDGGHRWPEDKGSFGPTDSHSCRVVPPLLGRFKFPPWGICIGIPNNTPALSIDQETQAFRQLVPIPLWEVERACRIVMLGILASVRYRDFGLFATSVEELRSVGFKKREIEFRGGNTARAIRVFEQAGLRGVSMSSWGPAIFGFAPTIERAHQISETLSGFSDNPFHQITVTRANNNGARISTSLSQDPRALSPPLLRSKILTNND